MLPDASKNSVVHCDICGEPMSRKQGAPSMEYYACYPCNNLIYASDLWRYDQPVYDPDAQVPIPNIRRVANATSGD